MVTVAVNHVCQFTAVEYLLGLGRIAFLVFDQFAVEIDARYLVDFVVLSPKSSTMLPSNRTFSRSTATGSTTSLGASLASAAAFGGAGRAAIVSSSPP